MRFDNSAGTIPAFTVANGKEKLSDEQATVTPMTINAIAQMSLYVMRSFKKMYAKKMLAMGSLDLSVSVKEGVDT